MGGAAARLRTRVNRRVYRWLGALYRTVFPSRSRGERIDPARIRRVLVVRHDRIGDMIVTLPLLSFLRETLPHAELDVLASPINRSVLEGDARVAHVFVNDRRRRSWPRLRRALRARRYDLVLSPIFGRGLREGLVAASVSHPETIRASVMRPPQYAGFFTHLVRTPRCATHMADRVLALGTRTLGAPHAQAAACWPMRMAVPESAEARACALLDARGVTDFLLVNLWSAEPWRAWPLLSAAPVLDRVRAAHPTLQIVLAPPPGKDADAAEAARRFGERTVVVPSSASIGDLAAVVRRARLVLSPDTALVHLASATGRPVVALYTARTVDPVPWRPYRVPNRVLTSDGGAPVSAIEPDDVFEAFESLWCEIETREG